MSVKTERKRLLICLLGGQTIPNVIAAAKCRPDAVWAVCSSESQALFENLRAALGHLPAAPSEVKLVEVPPYDFDTVRNTLEAHLAPECLEKYEVTIDLTGGTKVMSLGLCHAAWRKKISNCEYVVSEQNVVLENLGMPTARRVPQEFNIPLAAYLAAHGFDGRPRPQPEVAPSLFKLLVKNLERTWTALNDLRENNAMQRFPATGGRLPFRLASHQALEFFPSLCRLGCGRMEEGGVRLNSFEQDFLWGHWVEYYAAKELESLCRNALLDDAWGSTPLFNREGRMWRELDAVAIRHGHLLVFSCKQSNEILRKSYFDNLEGTRRDLGRYVSLFLLSVGSAPQAIVDGARRQGIIIIHSNLLADLRALVMREVSRPTVAL